MRKAGFRPRTDVRPSFDTAQGDGFRSEKDGEDICGALLGKVREAESVSPNPAAGRRLTRAWKEVLYEMVAVSVGIGAVCTKLVIYGIACMRKVSQWVEEGSAIW